MNEALLEEFVAWREGKAQAQQDLSPRAFLDERENELNKRRISEAVTILANAESHLEYKAPTRDWAQTTLTDIRRALIGDRDVVIDQTISGVQRVEIL